MDKAILGLIAQKIRELFTICGIGDSEEHLNLVIAHAADHVPTVIAFHIRTHRDTLSNPNHMGQRPARQKSSMQTEQTRRHWQSVNFRPPSLSCFTGEGLALPWVSISGQVDRQGLTEIYFMIIITYRHVAA
ncbi:hypothetical protein N7524_011776 [Penicillium chrysogenum]|nr:hypothetical protein N7524_011776 [Penicillium chrysogenum]